MTTRLYTLPAALAADLTAALRARFGPAVTIAAVEPISRRAAVSARLRLEGAGAPPGVFVKHVFPEDYPAHDLAKEHVEFAEELLAQRFLEDCPPARVFRPALLAWSERGFMLTEDLGPEGHAEVRAFDYLCERLARSLATLHAATRDREPAYQALRTTSGLAEDRRRYGTPAQQWRFGLGRDYLLALAGDVDRPALTAELTQVADQINAPGAFRTLIHDDLGNARQTFEVADELYLLDFEYAKYGHALVDLGKPLLGKFELRLTDGYYCWNNPGFPLTLADAYRRHFEFLTGRQFSDAEWQAALAAALVFHALTLLGRLQHLEPDRRLIGTLAENRNGILYHLWRLLPPAQYPALRQLIYERLNLAMLPSLAAS